MGGSTPWSVHAYRRTDIYRPMQKRCEAAAIRSVMVIALLSVVGQAHAKEPDLNPTRNARENFVGELVENMVHKLFDRTLQVTDQSADLDNTTLAKPPQLAISTPCVSSHSAFTSPSFRTSHCPPRFSLGSAAGAAVLHNPFPVGVSAAAPLGMRDKIGMRVNAENVLAAGDTVAVVGASGNVGRLVALRLADTGKFKVRAGSRDPSKVESFFKDKKVESFKANTREAATLKEVLSGANCVIVCTGTTAFKTKAWDGGNTPDAVDNLGVKNVVDTWISSNPKASLKRFVLMSSIGVTRRTSFPYFILNGGGVLDAKQKGEDAVTTAASEYGFDYSIVRPGQLTGGPYTNNKYLGTLFKIEKSASQRVKMERGDTIVGDTQRSTLAEIIAQSIESSGPVNLDFVIVNERGEAPSTEVVQKMLAQLPTSEGNDQVQGPRFENIGETVSQAVSNLFSGKVFDKQ